MQIFYLRPKIIFCMSSLDWFVLTLTLAVIITYGLYKSRTSKNLDGYFLSNRSMPWYLVLLSIMGTQASAITFISGPGQAYTDGMRFVQYYFGLPLAMIVISYFFVPVFSRLKVYTAYEFLEQRFDLKTRTLTSALFLISRGLSTGISIFAPSIILSSLLGWNIYYTNLVMGGLLIIYTMSGGAKAVAHTQKLQMIIIFVALFLVGYIAVKMLPGAIGFADALQIGRQNGKMNVITTGFTEKGFDWKDKYNLWSGIIGGFFLALSYFGTDHSQVGRYLTARDESESKKGLLMNGLVKVPMQFFILLLGVLVFAFYQFHPAPVIHTDSNITTANSIFLHFVLDYLPQGLIGLIIAIIFLAAWGSIAAALNSLAACTVIDFHKKFFVKNETDVEDYKVSQWYTLAWGICCIIIAMFAYNIGNSLIEAVNIIGSLFYGVILGIFLVAFWLKYIKENAVFVAAIISEILVILIYRQNIISFLWLNVIGAILVIITGFLLQFVFNRGRLQKEL
ncbi:MAG TPA: sodium:solute symporter [Chitinophagaceae bacterium]|nr:sodium:solute symporter [Chitinophagaceae bacterium]